MCNKFWPGAVKIFLTLLGLQRLYNAEEIDSTFCSDFRDCSYFFSHCQLQSEIVSCNMFAATCNAWIQYNFYSFDRQVAWKKHRVTPG